MAYINTDWLKINKEVIAIMSKYSGVGEDLSSIMAMVDREIKIRVINIQGANLTVDDITVDDDDYVTSLTLQSFGIYWSIYLIYLGWTGSGYGNPNDIYGQEAEKYERLAEKAALQITESSIVEGDGEEIIADDNPVLWQTM